MRNQHRPSSRRSSASSARKSPNPWSDADIQTLGKFARGGTPLPALAARLNRSEQEVRRKARALDISLEPPPNSPYARSLTSGRQ